MQLPLSSFNFGGPVAAGPAAPVVKVKMKGCLDGEARCDNIRSALLRGLPSVSLEAANERPVALACYGPSLLDQLEILRAINADIISVSGAHDVLIDAGIVPYAHVESDPRAHKARFFSKPHKGVRYLIASSCHRDVFDALRGFDVSLWHVANSKEEDAFIAAHDPEAFVVLGGTSVGTRAICLSTALGRSDFYVFGMDCSFSGDKQHAGFHPNPAEMLVNVTLPSGEKFLSSPQMLQNAQDFLSVVAETPSCRYQVFGDSLLKKVLGHANIKRAA